MFPGEYPPFVSGTLLWSDKEPLKFCKLSCCLDNTAVQHEVAFRIIPSILRLSLWDAFESSLNPPTRWSSSLHDGKERRHVNKLNDSLKSRHVYCTSMCVSYLPSLQASLSVVTAFTKSGTSHQVLEPSQWARQTAPLPMKWWSGIINHTFSRVS